jgi:hypothetical protein
MPKTVTPDLPQDAHIPVGTPPSGGCWTWSAELRDWVRLPEPTATPAKTEAPQE